MKRKLVYLFLIIIAIYCGYFLGNFCAESENPIFEWLGKSITFGFDTANLDLYVIQLNLGLHVAINALEILFIGLAIVLAPKVDAAIK